MSVIDDSSGRVGELLRRLVASHVPNERLESVMHVANRLLESALTTSPSIQTPESISHAMLFRLVRDGRHAESTQLAELTSGLKFERALHQDAVWPILYVLNDLRGSGADYPIKKPHPLSSSVKQLASDADDELSRSPPSTEIVGDDGSPSYRNDTRDEANFSRPGVSASPFEPGIEIMTRAGEDFVTDSEDDDDNFYLMKSTKKKKPRKRTTNDSVDKSPAIISTACSQSPTPLQNKSLERQLVQDLLLIVQGENGKLLSFADSSENEAVQINMPSGVDVTMPTRDIVMYVSEIGFLFRIIQRRVEGEESEKRGLVDQNMCIAIVREMDTYYRSLATLRRIAESSESFTATGDEMKQKPGDLSLRKIYVWAESEKPRLRCLARLCEDTRELHGGKVVGHLRAHRGSYLPTAIHEMMSRILASTAAPINRMLQRWLLEGVVADHHGEFFIMEDPRIAAIASKATPYSAASLLEEVGVIGGLAGGPNSASMASQRIWWGLFKLRKDQLPGSIDSRIVQKALIAGKSIAFLRRCCMDSSWVDKEHTPLIAGLASDRKKLFEGDPRFDGDHVRALVEAAKDSASRRLKTLFFDRFDLSHHFGAIKNYLLLSQGDFSQALMDGLAPILDGDADILRNNLTGIVDSALQQCSSFNEETDQDILERLDVQIAPQGKETEVGWDVFSLTYRVEDAPLNTVFAPKVMDAYLLIFRLLWRLKRMDHLMSMAYLSLCWFEDQKRRRKEGEDEELWREMKSVVRRAHHLRMKMSHVVQNMQHYCTVEVLEGSWTLLERDMAAADDLDGMIHAHSVYLTRIKDRTLLSDRSKYVATELSAVLNVIPKFNVVQEELSAWADRGRLHEHAVGSNDIERVKDRLEAIDRSFNESLDKFLAALKRHCRIVDSCVFLLFRLDFNGHYARRRQMRGEEMSEPSPSPRGRR